MSANERRTRKVKATLITPEIAEQKMGEGQEDDISLILHAALGSSPVPCPEVKLIDPDDPGNVPRELLIFYVCRSRRFYVIHADTLAEMAARFYEKKGIRSEIYRRWEAQQSMFRYVA